MDTPGEVRVKRLFPGLHSEPYLVTSPSMDCYNCVAWALGATEAWFDPSPVLGYTWPKAIAANGGLASYIALFESFGFSLCDQGDLETGTEKIVIYTSAAGDFTHVARQLCGGKWTSKLGVLEDIEHTLAGLEGDEYGRATQFMKRSSVSAPGGTQTTP